MDPMGNWVNVSDLIVQTVSHVRDFWVLSSADPRSLETEEQIVPGGHIEVVTFQHIVCSQTTSVSCAKESRQQFRVGSIRWYLNRFVPNHGN